MARELFRQVLEHHPSAPARRLSALPLSVAVHALALVAVIVIPLVATDVLPLVRTGDVAWTPVVLPPSPPPIPAPVSRRPSRRTRRQDPRCRWSRRRGSPRNA